MRVRDELLAANERGGTYVPRMEAVHVKNAARLRELIERHGWPAEDLAGKDGAEAAWLIAQHAIGEPEFQRRAPDAGVRLRGPNPGVARGLSRGSHRAVRGPSAAFRHVNGSMIPATAGSDPGGSPTPGPTNSVQRGPAELPSDPERGPDCPRTVGKTSGETTAGGEWLASKGWPDVTPRGRRAIGGRGRVRDGDGRSDAGERVVVLIARAGDRRL